MDSDLKIAAVDTKPMAIVEMGSDEERQTRLRRKKETLGMDDTLDVPLTRGSEGSDARGSRDPVAHPVETSIAQRTAPEAWWITRASSGGKESQRKERPNWSTSGRESYARAHAHEFSQLVELLRASKSRGRSTSQRTTQRARVPDHHGGLLLYA